LACNGNPQLTDPTLRPCALEPSNRFLSSGTQTHRRVDEDVVEVAVAVEIHGQKVGVLMTLERLPFTVLPGQLGAVGLHSPACSGYECAVDQLRLGQRSITHRQRR
jgi:hypothetical protein